MGELEERDTKKRTEGKNPKGGGKTINSNNLLQRSEVGARGSLCPSAPSTKTETEEALLRCFLPSSGKRGKKRGRRTRRRITFVNVERHLVFVLLSYWRMNLRLCKREEDNEKKTEHSAREGAREGD